MAIFFAFHVARAAAVNTVLPFAETEGAPLDAQGTALYEGPRHLAVGAFQNAPESGAADLHVLRRFLLVVPFHMSQTQGFQFLYAEHNLFQVVQ